jgi:hypothetical protein
MIPTRSARALAGGLAAVFLLVSATAAYAAVTGTFSGQTGQKKSISLSVAHGYVTHLQFHINDTCPSGHVYSIHDFNFPKIKIDKFHKFDGKFTSTTSKAQVEITGTVSKQQVKGNVTETRFLNQEHHNCVGSSKYVAKKQ